MPSGAASPPTEFTRAVTGIIRRTMDEHGLNIAELGRKAGIARSTLSKIVNDVRAPQMAQIRRISLALGVPLPHLIEEAEQAVGVEHA